MPSESCSQLARLRDATRLIVRELGYLESQNPYADATMPQIHALIEIDRHGVLTVAELARVLNLNQSSTCRTVADMRKLGWVETQELPNDRKRKPILLTETGQKKLAEVNDACGSVYQHALDRLVSKQQAAIVEAFTVYADALSQARADLENRKTEVNL